MRRLHPAVLACILALCAACGGSAGSSAQDTVVLPDVPDAVSDALDEGGLDPGAGGDATADDVPGGDASPVDLPGTDADSAVDAPPILPDVPPLAGIRVDSPKAAAKVSGSISCAIVPVGTSEAVVDTLTVKVDDIVVLTDRKVPTDFVLDTATLGDGPHVVSASATQAGNTWSDQIQVKVDNPPFRFEAVYADREHYANGDTVTIAVQTGATGLSVSADFSKLDSGFKKAAVSTQDLGAGLYVMVRYTLTAGNQVQDGDYPVPVTVSDNAGHTLVYDALSVTLANRRELPAVVEGGIFVRGPFPGPTGSPDSPTLGEFTAPDIVIPGGSAVLRQAFDDPQGVATVVGLIVGLDGYPGYYQKPFGPSKGIEDAVLLLRQDFPDLQSTDALKVRVAARDLEGNVSEAKTASLELVKVLTGDVQVSLSWDVQSDVDLHVIEPGGQELWYGSPSSDNGGVLDLDSNAACDIDGKRNENVSWPPGEAPSGTYIVRVDYFMNCDETARVNWVVTVNRCGKVETFSGILAADQADEGDEGSGVDVTTFQTGGCVRKVHGTARYQDRVLDERGFLAKTWKPIRHATVEAVRASDGAVLATGRTGLDGTYRLSFDNDGTAGFYVRVKSASPDDDKVRRVIVRNQPTSGQVYAAQSVGVVDEGVMPDAQVDLYVDEASGGGAFNIFDVLVEGNDRLRLEIGRPVGELAACWQAGATATFYCSDVLYGQGKCKTAGLIQIGGMDDARDEYDDQVLLKEFFRFVLDRLSRDDNPGGAHDGTRDVPKRAWAEGATTFLSSRLRGSRWFVDSERPGVYRVLDLQTLASPFANRTADGTQNGPLSEYLVAAVLWRLSGTGDTATIANGWSAILDTLFDYLPWVQGPSDRGQPGVDFVDFLDGWFFEKHGQKDAVAQILAEHEFPYDFAGTIVP